MKNYYHILGVDKTATINEIKEAYRKLSKKFHPDLNNNDPFFEEQFKLVNEAYEVLSDAWSRSSYDSQLGETAHQMSYSPTTSNANDSIVQWLNKDARLRFLFMLVMAVSFLGILMLFYIRNTYQKQFYSPLQEIYSTSSPSASSNYKQETEPERFVKAWIAELGSKDFTAAYNRMSKDAFSGSLESFGSTKAYGGIYKTQLIACYMKYEKPNEALVVADYNSYDSQHKDGNFVQEFYLEKIEGLWFIQKIDKLKVTYF
ncbi:MAG: J domain-containing protein [Chitinophagales bacterium]